MRTKDVDGTYRIDEQYIRRQGRIMALLATLGLVIGVFSVLLASWGLYQVQGTAVGGMRPFAFLLHTYVHGETAPYNLLSMAKVLVVLMFLACVRHLVRNLASADPLGKRTVQAFGLLAWPCLAMLLVLAWTATPSAPVDVHPVHGWLPRGGVSFDFEPMPVYSGVPALCGISMPRRVVRQTVRLKPDNEAFV